MKTYKPPEYHCAQCGKLFITRDVKAYAYRRRDNRVDSETNGRVLYFCSYSCMNRFENTYPARKKHGGR